MKHFANIEKHPKVTNSETSFIEPKTLSNYQSISAFVKEFKVGLMGKSRAEE